MGGVIGEAQEAASFSPHFFWFQFEELLSYLLQCTEVQGQAARDDPPLQVHSWALVVPTSAAGAVLIFSLTQCFSGLHSTPFLRVICTEG